MVRVIHLGSLFEPKTVLNLPVSNLSHRAASQLNNILDYHWAMRSLTCFLSEPKLRYPCSLNIFSLGTFIWPLSSHRHSSKKETILCCHRSYSNARTHMHTHILDQKKFQCLFNQHKNPSIIPVVKGTSHPHCLN